MAHLEVRAPRSSEGDWPCCKCGQPSEPNIVIDAGHIFYPYCPLCILDLAKEIASEARHLLRESQVRDR